MKNRNYQPIIYALILILGIIFGQYNIISNTLKGGKIDSIIRIIEENYVDEFDIEEYEEAILKSIMNELDPHSNYIPKEEQTYLEEGMQGSFSGVGIEFNIIQDSLVVISPISGGPSEKLGVLSGDRIIEVDGENIASIGITNEDVFEKLRGKKESKVNIKIYRKGNNRLLEYTIVRGDIPMYSVDASFMIDIEIGYVKVNRFSATTNQEFYEATNKLLSSGMKKLILDLRGNPGGYLGSAIYMCNEFLKEGELIVYTNGEYRKKEEIFSDKYGRLQDIELAVLIDEGSASASEIVSGCMQDLDRGIIIGKRSFGKGLVQEEIKLSDGSAVRLTTQRYYMPSGRSIQKPYGDSELQYNLEKYDRNNNEGLQVSDSLKYTTKNGRIVFGGGGVTPDSVIFTDTTLNYTKVNQLRSKNWVSEFSLYYQNRVDKSIGYNLLDRDLIYLEFKNYLERKNYEFDLTIGATEERYLKNFIKATIAKNIWDENVYFKILFQDDEYVLKAIQSLN
tara:strand:- start:1497 stop:3017 length:1521 start_codon:yes stop_codon:yes gene_type:complete